MRKNEQLIGAAAERKAILRKLRMMTTQKRFPSSWIIADMIEWLLKRCERYNARKGGLGRKRKGV